MRIIPSKDVPPPDPFAAQGLLGPFLPQPPGLVLLSGEASAGKTVLAYNIACHIAEGREFIGLTPTASLSILYIDLESPEQQVHRRMVEAIGRSDNLAFGRDLARPLYTSEGQKELMDAIEVLAARVVFIDPLTVAWPCKDENDNAEADRQMWRLKEIALATGTLIVALWNMGGGYYVREKYRARGATARLDRVDLALNYAEVSDTRRKLTIVKSRYGNLKESITVQFAEDFGFKVVAGVDVSLSQTQLIEAHIVTLVSERQYSRQELLAALRKVEITNDNLVDKALGTLRRTGKVTSPERGVYASPESSDSQ